VTRGFGVGLPIVGAGHGVGLSSLRHRQSDAERQSKESGMRVCESACDHGTSAMAILFSLT
jgi:hypothetical protein